MAAIGIDARLTHYRVGGISRHVQQIIAALPAAPDHDITILQSRKSQSALSDRFARARVWTPPHHRLERLALSLELQRHRFDLLHSPDFIAPLRCAKRHIVTVHDLSFLLYPDDLTAESRRYYAGQIEASLRQADHILAVSHATKRDIVDLLKIAPDKITVHWNGVDERFRQLPRKQTAPVIEALGLPAEYLLFVGTIEPRKNLVGLARAYRELLLDLPDAPKLVIAGQPGWHYHQLMADINALGLSERLIFRHNVSDGQLPALYNQALALITPSYYEGFGLPALEAMACGALPIVSDVSSFPEITGDVGLLVDPADSESIAAAIKRALSDSELRRARAIAGIKRSQRFSWGGSAKIVSDCYRAVLN